MAGAPEKGYYDKRGEKYCTRSTTTTSVGIEVRGSEIGITS